jgi:hypothetical protein
LVDTNNSSDIASDFNQIDLSQYPSNVSFTIRVEAVQSFKTIAFDLESTNSSNPISYKFTDNKAPYALGGGTRDGNFNPVKALVVPNSYSLTVTTTRGHTKATIVHSSATLSFTVLPSFRVTGFTLVNAIANEGIISGLFDINPSLYPTNTSFTIRADTVGTVASVAFTLTQLDVANPTTVTTVDSTAPFSLDGNAVSGKYGKVPALTVPGLYLLQAVPYSGLDKTGQEGPVQQLYFQVESNLQIVDITLVDATTSTDLQTGFFLNDIDLEIYANTTFTIRVDTFPGVGSVEFNLSQYITSNSTYQLLTQTVDNTVPFTLDGTSDFGRYHAVPALSVPGSYQLQVTLYDLANKQGLAGGRMTYAFNVLSSVRITYLSLVDVSTGINVETLGSVTDIDLITAPSTGFTVSANTSFGVQSVVFNLSQYDQKSATYIALQSTIDNSAPFTLDGNSVPGHFIAAPLLTTAGTYQLVATPYSGTNKQGQAGPLLVSIIDVLSKVRVDNVTLVDVDTGVDLETLSASTIIDLSLFNNSTAFTLKANTPSDVGSVEFQWSSTGSNLTVLSIVDSVPPFSVDGDSSPGAYEPFPNLTAQGTYYLQVTPYGQANKQGVVGPTSSFTLTIYPRIQISEFVFVDVTSGIEVQFFSAYTLDLLQYPSDAAFTILANTTGTTVGSVEFTLTQNFNNGSMAVVANVVDNEAPFSLDGDSVAGQYAAAPALNTPGYYTLLATPYEGVNKEGGAGPTRVATLYISARIVVTNFTLVDAPTGKDVELLADFNQFTSNSNLTIRADVDGTVGSVIFTLIEFDPNNNSNSTITSFDSVAPFSLDGDSVPGKYLASTAFTSPIFYYLEATAYSGPSGKGEAGSSYSIRFQVLATSSSRGRRRDEEFMKQDDAEILPTPYLRQAEDHANEKVSNRWWQI